MKSLIWSTLSLSLLVATGARAQPTFTFAPNMPPSLKNQIAGDLNFLESIEGTGATPLHQRIFGQGAIAGSAYLDFFSARITGFRVDLNPTNKVAVAYNRQGLNKLFLTPNFIKNDIPQVMRITVFLHEARHSERQHGFWSHSNCPDPYLDREGKLVRSIMTGIILSGEAACDKTAFGAYGIQAIALKNIQAFCANCTDKVKMDAGLYGDNDIDSRIIDSAAKQTLTNDLGQ